MLERDALLPGDALVDAVSLNVAKPIDAATLRVRVRGRQTLNWTTSSGDAMIAHAKKMDLLTEEHNFEYKCKRIEELQGFLVCVQYDVEATLAAKGVTTADLSAKARFRVRALPLAVPFGRRIGAAREDTVKFMTMFKRGSCHVSLSINTDILDAESTIEARVLLQLNTTQVLKYTELVLYEDVLVNSHNHIFPGHKRGTRPICSRRFERETIASAEPVANASLINLQLQLPISAHTIDKTEVLNPTMTSFFVNVSYRVAVAVKFSMAPRIRVHTPVTIIPRLVAPRDLEVVAVP